MASASEWIGGARPRTLPTAIAPVAVGAGAAAADHRFDPGITALILITTISLVIGVNYANDYSDGVRGTDDHRVGPMRLVGSGAARPSAVLAAAVGCLGLAGLVGTVVVLVTGRWPLAVLGVLSIAGAWFYTGGGRPYGYAGWGELAVFVFFGPIGVLGTEYALSGRISWYGVAGAIGVGLFTAAVLVANNLRDIATDTAVGKRTLAVTLGHSGTRRLYPALVIAPFALTISMAGTAPWVLIALPSAALIVPSARRVRSGATGGALITVLKDTAVALLTWSVLVGVGSAI